MSHIFISYSRSDIDFAQKIVDTLAANKLDTWIDWKSIPKGEDWKEEIYRGIDGADAFLFLLSPDSVVSQMCNNEIAHAVAYGKRILPIVIRDADERLIPPEISKRNWIFCRDGQDDFDKAIAETRETIHTDYEWLKYHTSLLVKALEWERTQDASRLLRGRELQEAEEILTIGHQDPYPTDLQRQFVLTSQRNESRTRRRFTFGLVIGLGVMVILAIFAWGQRNSAIDSAATAVSEGSGRATALAGQKTALVDAQNQESLARSQESIARTQEAIAIQNEATAIANEKEAQRQALLALSENLSALALARIDTDYTQSLLLGVESYRLLEENGFGQIGDPDILPTLLQKTQAGLTQTLVSPPSGTVWKVAYSRDGKFMASASDTLDLWDTTNPGSPKLIKSWADSKNKTGASDVAFNADASILAVGYWDGHVELWGVRDLSQVFTFTEYQSDALINVRVAFNPSGKYLAIAMDRNIYLWDMTKPDDPKQLPGISNPQKNTNVDDLFFLPAYQNYLVSIGEDNSFHVWDLERPESPKIVRDYEPTDEILSIAISPDNRFGFVMASSQHLYFFDPQMNFIDRFYYHNDQSEPIYNLTFLANKQRLFTASNDGTIVLWDISDPYHVSLVAKYSGHANLINSMVSHPGGKTLASGGFDSKIVLWNISQEATPALWQERISFDEGIADIAYSPKNDLLAIGYGNSKIDLWDVSDQTNLGSVALKNIPSGQPVIKVAFSPDENTLASMGGARRNFIPTVFIWKLANIEHNGPQHLFELNTSDYFVVDGNYVLAGETNGNNTLSTYLWDLSNPAGPAKRDRLDSAACPTKDTSTTPNSEIIAVASCSIQLWDFSPGAPPHVISNLTPYDPQSVSFSWDGKMLASGNGDNSVMLWSVSTSRDGSNNVTLNTNLLNQIDVAHFRSVTSVAFSSDGRTLATGGEDQTINLWDIADPSNPVKKYSLRGNSDAILNGGIYLLANKKILVSASQNEVIFWDIDPQSWLEKACTIAGRNFTELEWQQLVGEEIPYHTTCPDFPSPID